MRKIGEALVQDDVLHAGFACNLKACKGACCTMEGARGAPLLDEEIPEIRKAAVHARKFLNSDHQKKIDVESFYEGTPGNYATTCIDGKACVFVFFENNIAKCSLERAYHEGLSDWIKPISCHLFPIRILNSSIPIVRYEQIEECKAARERGQDEEIQLTDFVSSGLKRYFGSEWYNRLQSSKNGSNA